MTVTDRKRRARALSDRAGTICKRATALSVLLRAAGYTDLARDMANISQKAAEVDSALYRDSR